MNKEELQGKLNFILNSTGETSQWKSGYKKGVWDSLMLARHLDDCIVDENDAYLIMRGISNLQDKEFDTFWDVLKGKRSLIVPQFVSEWYEKNKEFLEFSIYSSTVSIHEKTVASEKLNEFEGWLNASANNGYEVLTHMKYGYEIEEVPMWKVPMWKVPIKNLVTSDGNQQYLTFDPKSLKYFASRKNEKLKQTFNGKELNELPGNFKKYAVKIEGEN